MERGEKSQIFKTVAEPVWPEVVAESLWPELVCSWPWQGLGCHFQIGMKNRIHVHDRWEGKLRASHKIQDPKKAATSIEGCMEKIPISSTGR